MTKEKKERRVTSVTVDSLLTEDNVKEAFSQMAMELPNIKLMICMYYDRDGQPNWITPEGTYLDNILALIDKVKFCLLKNNGQSESKEEVKNE